MKDVRDLNKKTYYLIRKCFSERANPKIFNTIKDARVGAFRSFVHTKDPWVYIYKLEKNPYETVGLYIKHLDPCELVSYDGTTKNYTVCFINGVKPMPTYVYKKDGSLGKRLR